MKRYLLGASVFLICGMVLRSTNSAAVVLFVLSVILICALICIYKNRYSMILLCFLMPVAGFTALNVNISKIDNLSTPFYNTMCECEGRVVNISKSDDYCYADVSVYSLKTYKESYEGKRTVRLYVYGKNEIKYGDIINFRAILKEPAEYNLSGRNQRQYLLSKGIGLTASCNPENIEITGYDFSYFNPKDWGYSIKKSISDRIDLHFSGNSAGFIKGILLGDKSDVSQNVYAVLRNSGLAHIVAVSGMHINILLGLAMSFFGIFGIKRRMPVMLVYIAIVWLMALVAGLSASCVRAACTVTIFYTAWFVKRNEDPLNSLGIAVLIILLVNPASFYDIGFRLSVASTAGILVFSDKISNYLKAFPKAINELVSVYFAAQIGIIPVTVHFFGTVSLTGLFANLIICPLLPLIFLLAILTLVACNIPFVGILLVQMMKFAVQAVLYTIIVFGSIPYATLTVGKMGAWGLSAYCAGVAGIYFFLKGEKSKTLTCLLAVSLVVAVISVKEFYNTDARLAFLNVGDGDCAIISVDGINIMVDSGGSDNFDVAQTAVIPHMDRAGISKIDIALISHYHKDHCLGFVTLMKQRKIKNIVLPLGIFENEMKSYLESVAKQTGTRLLYITDGKKLTGSNLTVTAFNSFADSNENNGMVYYFDYGANRICFSGDVEASGEQRLLLKLPKIRCDILKVAHHGSKTSSTPEFIRAAMPKYAVISRNDSNCPARTLDTLKLYGATVYSTAEQGTLTFELNRDKILSVKTQRSLDDEF